MVILAIKPKSNNWRFDTNNLNEKTIFIADVTQHWTCDHHSPATGQELVGVMVSIITELLPTFVEQILLCFRQYGYNDMVF